MASRQIEILSGGQTGIDMGAALTALDLGVSLSGYMPADGCNETGPIPDAVAMHLRRHDRTNPAARTRANVATADAALVIVQDRRRAGATRGTALTIRLCEKRDEFGLLVVDPTWDSRTVVGVVLAWRRSHEGPVLRLLVAGPRASLWPEGEQVARRFVKAIVEEVRRG